MSEPKEEDRTQTKLLAAIIILLAVIAGALLWPHLKPCEPQYSFERMAPENVDHTIADYRSRGWELIARGTMEFGKQNLSFKKACDK